MRTRPNQPIYFGCFNNTNEMGYTNMTQPDNPAIKGLKSRKFLAGVRKAPDNDGNFILNPRLAEAYRQDFAPEAKNKTSHKHSEYQHKTLSAAKSRSIGKANDENNDPNLNNQISLTKNKNSSTSRWIQIISRRDQKCIARQFIGGNTRTRVRKF